METNTNKNRSKWLIGGGILVALVVAGYAVFAGPMGDQLTGSLYKVGRIEMNEANLKPIAMQTDTQKLATCQKDLAGCNVCLDIVKHTGLNDLTPWMAANGITATQWSNCATRLSNDILGGIGNWAYSQSDLGRKSQRCGEALNLKNYSADWKKYLSEHAVYLSSAGTDVILTPADCVAIGYTDLAS